jgi:hypothetical protein
MMKDTFLVKKHITPDKRLFLAVCDTELFGKIYEQDDLILDLGSDYFKGKESSEAEAVMLITGSYMVYAVGDRSVALCLKEDIIDKGHIKRIQKIPFVHVILG